MSTALAAPRPFSTFRFWRHARTADAIGIDSVPASMQRHSVESTGTALRPKDSAACRLWALESDGCEALSELVHEFVNTCPAARQLVAEVTDFCDWCWSMSELTARQQECLHAASQSRSIESLALRRRLAGERFERVLATDVTQQSLPGDPARGRWHLHPQHVWSASGNQPQPASSETLIPVLLVSTTRGVHAVPVSAALLPALQRLSQRGAQSLRQLLAAVPRQLRDRLLNELQNLRCRGVVAQDCCAAG